MIDPVALTQELIRCDSVTPRDNGALDVLQSTLQGIGFTCHRLPYGEKAERVDNLFARLGTGAPHFCFAGHSDVVPAGSEAEWTHPPFAAHIENGVLYGRGAEDMKAAIAAFTAAASAFVSPSMQGSISLLITGDEEGVAVNGTRKMLEWLREHDQVPDICLVGEPTNPDTLGQMIKIGRRGSVSFTLTVHGKQGHAAYPRRADNPVTRLIRILYALKSHVLDTGTDYFQPSNLEITTVDVGNPAVNVIPSNAKAKFNIRFNDTHSSRDLRAWVENECAQHATQYTLDCHVTGEAFLTPPGPFSEAVALSVQEITGLTPDLSTTGGTSDARFIKDYCPVVEFGITGKTPHMTNECVAVDDIAKLTDIYTAILRRVLPQ